MEKRAEVEGCLTGTTTKGEARGDVYDIYERAPREFHRTALIARRRLDTTLTVVLRDRLLCEGAA